MAAKTRRIRTLDGECLDCLAEEFDEKFRPEPARYRISACSICLGPLLTPMVVVECKTWETLRYAWTVDELGRGFKISNASKVLKLVGFPPDLLSIWMEDIATIRGRESLHAHSGTASFDPCNSVTMGVARSRESVAGFAGGFFILGTRWSSSLGCI
jgi:hypothetical protein